MHAFRNSGMKDTARDLRNEFVICVLNDAHYVSVLNLMSAIFHDTVTLGFSALL